MGAEKKSRLLWLDQARAIAMFIVVLGHNSVPTQYIYSFHMPLFFIISGITFNPYRYEEFTGRVKDKFKKLVLPHFWMNLLTLPLWIVTWKIVTTSRHDLAELIKGIFYINSNVYKSPSNATWFLAVLFMVDILFYLTWKFSKGNTQSLVICTCILGLIGFIESKNSSNYEGPWHVEAVFTAIVFYMLGYMLKLNLDKITDWLSNLKNWAALCVVTFFVGSWCACTNGRVSFNGNSYDSILYFYTAAVCLSAFVIMVSMKLPQISLLSYIGQNTIAYLGIHIPLIRIMQYLYPVFTERIRYAFVLACIVYFAMVPIVWVINKFFPFIVSKNIGGGVATKVVMLSGILLWVLSMFKLVGYAL